MSLEWETWLQQRTEKGSTLVTGNNEESTASSEGSWTEDLQRLASGVGPIASADALRVQLVVGSQVYTISGVDISWLPRGEVGNANEERITR